MLYFLLSILILILGPLLVKLLERHQGHLHHVERFVFFIVVLGVVGHILPHSFAISGFFALIPLFLGWLVPFVFESLSHRLEEYIHKIPLMIAITGIAVHGFMDGLGLSLHHEVPSHLHGNHHEELHTLPLLIVLHRLPAAMILWWIVEPRSGIKMAALCLSLLGLTTALGYFLATYHLEFIHDHYYNGLFQALVAGSLLHLAQHHKHKHPNS